MDELESMRQHRRRGIFLITFALWAVALLGVAGVALDGGRLFVTRNEAQAFADAAALAAAQKLDGTAGGLRAARQAAQSNANTWDFGTQAVKHVEIDFATSDLPEGWAADPSNPAGYTRVRVTARVDQTLFFAPLFVVKQLQLVRVHAVAEQTRASIFHRGLWPYSVLSFAGQTEPHFGLTPGRLYTIRYTAGKGCDGDQADAGHLRDGMSRTWWGRNGESVLRERIVAGTQVSGEEVAAGKPLPDVNMPLTGGAAFLEERRMQDTDSASANYQSYIAGRAGNGRRVVVLPIQDARQPVVKGFGMFFLPASQPEGGPWCVEYAGQAYLPNSRTPGAGEPGAYAIRLVREKAQ